MEKRNRKTETCFEQKMKPKQEKHYPFKLLSKSEKGTIQISNKINGGVNTCEMLSSTVSPYLVPKLEVNKGSSTILTQHGKLYV